MIASRAERPEVARSRELILDTVELMFPEYGLDMSMNEIAARAGLGPATVYRRFAHHDDLMKALYDRAFDRFAVLFETLESIPPGVETVTAFLKGAVELNNRYPSIPAVARRMGRIDPLYRPSEVLVKPLERHVALAQESGALRSDVMAVDLAIATVALGALTSLPEPARTATSMRQLQIILAGLRPESERFGALTADGTLRMEGLHDLVHSPTGPSES